MRADDPRHGSVAGYNAHRKSGVEPCTECRRAMATYGARLEYDHMRGFRRKVPVTGTARRIQALVAIGYTFGSLGEALGTAHDVPRHLALHRTWVRADTAARVADLFDRLADTPPPAGKASRYALTTARRRGWRPPSAWFGVDIDDPDAQPDPGWQPRGYGQLGDLIEDFDWLVTQGESPDAAAARIGVTARTIDDYRRRLARREEVA